MSENIDKQVERAIGYYLRFALKNRQTIERELQGAAITHFNLNDRQISEFRLKIYQLNMASQYTSQYTDDDWDSN
jgi:D-aminopeptidase